MPKIAELVTVFSPIRAKLICDDLAVSRYVEPGFVMMWFGGVTPYGWLTLDGKTIGNEASGATARAREDVFTLYENLYNSLANAQAPVSGGRGSSAQADFDAGKTLTLPDMRQRFPLGKAASGTGSTIGGTGGSVDHAHSVPAHYHGMGAGADFRAGGGVPKFDNVGGSYEVVNAGGANYRDLVSSDATGRIGLVTGGVDGNAAMTTDADNPPYIAVNFIIAY